MATTIVPALGAGALFTQGGVGASPGYSAIDRRRADSPGLQAGVMGPTDFMVVQRGAGANMSVDITMTAGGGAIVAGSSVSGQGLYYVPVHASTVNEAIAAAHATLPRIDSVYLQIQDTTHDASGQNRAQITVVTGTATSGATLTNRTGAGAAPTSSLLLADVLVGAAVATIPNTVIRDRRPWARGAFKQLLVTTQFVNTTHYGSSRTDLTGLSIRVECSGAPIVVRWSHAQVGLTGVPTYNVWTSLAMDGSDIDTGGEVLWSGAAAPITYYGDHCVQAIVAPAAGSHVFTCQARTDAPAGASNVTGPHRFVVEEITRQNVANNAVTSG